MMTKITSIDIFNSFSTNFQKKKKSGYCINCGKTGHVSKKCLSPVLSYGVILFKIEPIEKDEEKKKIMFEKIKKNILSRENETIDFEYEIKYLIVRRKHSVSYIEFIRGKYSVEDDISISYLLSKMSEEEREFLKKSTDFDSLWKKLWGDECNKKKHHKADYKNSKIKFNLIKSKINSLMNIDPILTNKGLEWGFPKGRRNYRENDKKCALREFCEETGLKENDFCLLNNTLPEKEEIIGSNNKIYLYTYYFGFLKTIDKKIHIHQENKYQQNEVGNIKWATYDETNTYFNQISPLRKDRINILKEINTHVNSLLKKNIPQEKNLMEK